MTHQLGITHTERKCCFDQLACFLIVSVGMQCPGIGLQNVNVMASSKLSLGNRERLSSLVDSGNAASRLTGNDWIRLRTEVRANSQAGFLEVHFSMQIHAIKKIPLASNPIVSTARIWENRTPGIMKAFLQDRFASCETCAIRPINRRGISPELISPMVVHRRRTIAHNLFLIMADKKSYSEIAVRTLHVDGAGSNKRAKPRVGQAYKCDTKFEGRGRTHKC